jgi:hypothetical protein
MKFDKTLVPVVEGLEPRWMLSASAPAAVPPPAVKAPLPPAQAAPAPGTKVTAQVSGTGNTQKLLILGTNGADAITITQGANFITVTSAAGTTTYAGGFTSVTMYGFAGDDTLRVTYSVTAAVTVYEGNGTDTVYDLGRGADSIYAGNGADTLISFDSLSKHQVYGGTGLDSFWVDAQTVLNNVTAAENAGGYVHKITQFQGGVSMTVNGQALADPSLTSYASRYANFASQPVFTDGPNYTDIRQGMLGDCYFVATLASIADTTPAAIRQAITPLGDGTFVVRFYRSNVAVYVRIDGDLPVTSRGALAYAQMSPTGESWVPLMEKAYAFFRTGANSYGSLEGGWMADVDTQVTNRRTQALYTGVSDQAMYNFIKTSLAYGDGVTLGSKSNASGPIVGNHAYMVKSVSLINGVMYVTVYNPWGYDGGATTDSKPGDGLITLTIAQMQKYFTAAVSIV